MYILINGEKFDKFTKFFMQMNFDAFASSFTITGEAGTMPQEMLYSDVEIYDDDDKLLLTGKLINYNVQIAANNHQVSLGGYSLGGLLEDVNVPNSMYPIQFNLMSLATIFKKLLDYFKLYYVIHPNVADILNKVVLKTGVSPNQSIKSFIAAQCSNSHVFVTHDEKGVIHFLRPTEQDAIDINEDDDNITSLSYRINGQMLHSPITVRKQVGTTDIGHTTIKNPYCTIDRPTTKIMHNGFHKDLNAAARNYLSAEMAGIKFYIVTTRFIKPGSLVTLTSKTIGIEKKKLFVENIRINKTPTNVEYSISCVPKEVFYQEILE